MGIQQRTGDFYRSGFVGVQQALHSLMQGRLTRTYCMLFVGLLLAQSVGAAPGARGVGIILGSPTGLSAKWRAEGGASWGAAVGWNLSGKGHFYVHVDHLRHSRSMVRKMDLDKAITEGQLLFYYGIGGRLEARSDNRLGVRLPLGFEYSFAEVPLAGFIEVAPLLDLVPSTEFDLQAAIGLRYLF